jgi:hypothetical protein
VNNNDMPRYLVEKADVEEVHNVSKERNNPK